MKTTKYSLPAQFVNIIFLALIFVTPILLGLNTSINHEFSVLFFVICWGIGTLLLADWYHFYYTNSFKECLSSILLGLVVSATCLVFQYLNSDYSLFELSLLHLACLNNPLLVKIYIVSLGLFCSSIISLPRLLLIKILTNNRLPSSN